MGAELQRVVQVVDDVKAESVSSADLDSVRTEAAAGMSALAASGDTTVSRLGSMEERLAEAMARPVSVPEHDHAEVATLRTELEADVVRRLQSHRAEQVPAFDASLLLRQNGPPWYPQATEPG